MLWSMTCKRAWGWLLCDAQDTFDESIRYLCDPPDTSLCLWMHHQGAGGQYFRCHSSWTSRIRLLGSAEQSKLQRTLCKKTWHIANNCIDHFGWAEQHKRRDHDTDIEYGKKHYMTLRRTISHFSPFYRWIVTWGASAILTPRQHNTTKKWNCPAWLEWFEPTTNFIFLLSLVCALVSGYDDNNITLRSYIWKGAEPNILSGGVVTVPWRTETSLWRFDHGWLSSARVCKFNMALIWH